MPGPAPHMLELRTWPAWSLEAHGRHGAAQQQQVGQAVGERAEVLGVARGLRLQPRQLLRHVLDAAQDVAQHLARVRHAGQHLP